MGRIRSNNDDLVGCYETDNVIPSSLTVFTTTFWLLNRFARTQAVVTMASQSVPQGNLQKAVE